MLWWQIPRPMSDSSCSNLSIHQVSCLIKQIKAGSSSKLASGVSGTGNIDCQEVPKLCAIWCAKAARPFTALADASHQNILLPTVVKNLPSVKVLSQSVHMLYTAVQDTLKKTLLKHNGAMYIGADTWQSPYNGFDILGVVIYCLVELAGGKFKLKAMPLDFVQLAKSHTGEYLAVTIQVFVKKLQFQNKICGIVTDNASNNLAMVLVMKKFKGDKQWTCCYAHILNLIAQLILRLFGAVNKLSTSKASGEDGKSSSDNSEGEDGEEQISQFDKDTTHPTHSSDDNDPVQPDNLEPKLTLDNIHNLSDKDEDNNLDTTLMCKQSLAKFCAVA
ncbi:hypothetical protein PSTT_13398 [Puccinia striiformis]|uniref:DUF659 domain-containing protein n=1 Tax=Puccinia striiformis TaxID=27350 RepID=A0A2S4US95_9BASI|nr:hypothetical protein PSTT_13398 [Puccinia striiformis]